MSGLVPRGYRLAGVHAGLKQSGKLDLTLLVSDTPATAAGVYTQNRVFAAPVAWDRQHTPASDIRAVVINSGNANACTGDRGLDDARTMARLAAAVCGAKESQALVMSTGVIGVFLDMAKVSTGIDRAGAALSASDEAFATAAMGIMTTDTVPKMAHRELSLGSTRAKISGLCKGAAMIGPNMATMLGLVFTDAKLDPDTAQRLLREAVEDSFNAISVEGHMSTNDTVLLLANGAAGSPVISGSDVNTFQSALIETCTELARAIPADGEGATHLITIDVAGCRSKADARRIARTVADSPLVKTAIHGADPNWGRIVSAAGYAGIEFDPANVSLELNGHKLYERGAPVAFDASAVSASIRQNRETHISLRFSESDAKTRFWTTDLTAEYVRLNADYTT